MNSKCGLGATYLGGGLGGFLVWAPLINQVEVHILSPEERIVPLGKVSRGYHYGVVQGVKPGTDIFTASMGTTSVRIPPPSSSPKAFMGHPRSLTPILFGKSCTGPEYLSPIMCFTNFMWGLLPLKALLTPSSHTWMN